MKTLFSFIFSLFIFLSVSWTSQAQINTTFTYADGYNACGESNLKITLKNISSDSIIPIIAEFQLNNAMQAISFGTSEPTNQTIISASGNTVLIVFKKALKASNSFDINVKMNSSKPCNLIGCGQFFTTTDSLTLTHSNKDFYIYNNNILSSPCLTYDETRFTNRLVSAFLGDTITRKIVLTNTGGGKFDGYLQFKDQFGEFVEIESIYSTNAGHTVISSGNINDSTYVFNGRFPNVPNGDSIVIIEKVIVRKCIKEDEGKSSIYIDWSCNNALCNKVNPYPIIAQIIKNKKKPEIVITKTLIPESNCMGSKTKYVYNIKNKGSRPATDVLFSMYSSDYNTYTYLSKNSLAIKDTTGLNLVLRNSSMSTLPFNNPEVHSFQHSCRITDPLYIWNFEFESIMPGDSFVVESEGFQCCPGDDTSNIEIKFESWNLGVKYKDECKEEEFSTTSIAESQNALSLAQFYEPIVTDMHEGDIATFEIFNNAFSTDFYRLNEDSIGFKIRIKLDTGLVYVPNSINISSIFGYTLHPASEQMLSGAGDGYIDTYLEAFFILPDTFRINKAFFTRFMRNSSVLFDLEAVCRAKVPSSRFTQDFYVVPDLNCPQTCDVLLGSFTTLISVHCPGCITPGWVATSHSSKRINLGEQDNDNNRLPDLLTYTPADRAKIKNNRCIPGDTLQTELNAFFQDGDATTGKNTHDLENNYGPRSFHFRYSYLSNRITMGKLFKIHSVKVYINDMDKSAIASGLDSIDLPLSCVAKIPNVNDSLADAEFFFDLSLDTLYKYGINQSYEYDPGDAIKIVSIYTILEPSSFYLSNPPTTKDPWLERENSPILLNSFQNLIYLTGNRQTVNDRTRADAGASFEADPNSLDSTMIYWCEGYGSASTIVGKRREVAFHIPKNIQCQERTSFSVAINPSGGIFRNVFPFEYRNFITIDSIQATVPAGYTYSDWTITNTIKEPDGFLEYMSCERIDTLKNLRVNGSLITISIDELYDRRTDFALDPCLDHLVYGDENIMTTISYKVTPDCDLPDEVPVGYTPPAIYYRVGPNKIPYKDTPVQEYCNPIPNDDICRFFPLVTEFTKVNAGLKASPVTNEVQLSQRNFCYPVSIEENKGGNAYYTFLKVKSLNNKVKADKLTHKETQKVYYPDASGLFRLDTTLAKTVNEYELCFSNICGELIEKDTVRLVYGHDCFEYPNADYANICKFDSIEHYVFPGTLQLGGAIFGPSEIKMCEPFEVSTIYNVTGIGGVDNMLLEIHKDSSSLLSASMSINDGSPVDVLSALIDSTSTLSLKEKILSIKSDGLKAGDKVTMVLNFNTDCQYAGGPISERAILVTSACDTLYGDLLTISPPTLIGFPRPDNKIIQSTYGELKNLGGQVEVTINAYNNAPAPTENKTRIVLFLPDGFTYANMASGNAPSQTTDTSLIWNLEAGIPASAATTFKPLLNYSTLVCDSIVFNYTLSDITVGCSSQPCVQLDSDFVFKVPVKCYPCPAAITLSERCKELPVFNVISWEYPTANYCPDDQTFIYKLYYSKKQNGTYVLLDSTHNKTYTHDSLEEYDGCYYVTVTDLQQGLTTQSEIACKVTCREQFQCADLFIPNLVTPNKDGNNDTFEITGAYTTLKVEIYNSWGSTVFKSDNYKNEWDAKGLADGVYYYHIYIDGSDQKCLGWIHVLGGK